MSKGERMYKDSPTLKRDEESGKMGVTKAEKKASRVEDGTDGMAEHEEGLPAVARHVMERRDMHSRHEAEHAIHDHGKGGDKEEMHTRHEKEHKEMHSRHEKEHGKHGHKEHKGSHAGEPEHKSKEKEGGDEKPKKEKVEEK